MTSIDDNVEKINNLHQKMQECMNEEQYEDALVYARNIIDLSKSAGKNKFIKEVEKSITSIQKKLKNLYKNINVDEKINSLRDQKQDFSKKGKFEDAIKISEKIIIIANIIGNKKDIQDEEEYIKSMEQKIKNRPTKVEIIDKIEKLKGIKREHAIKQEIKDAINISKEIIKYAKMAGVAKIIEEEEDSIKSFQKILDKEQYITDGINEFKTLKKDYMTLVKYKAIKQAHILMKDFYEKYSDIPQVLSNPDIEKDIEDDKKQWVTFRVEKNKIDKEKLEQEGEAIARKKIVKLEMEKVRLEEEKSRLRREISKLKRNYEYSESGKARIELEKEVSQLEVEKKRLENERTKFEEIKKRWEVEKAKLEPNTEEEDNKNTLLEVEKTEIEEARENLSIDITRFMEEKEDFNTKKLNFEETLSVKEEEFNQKASALEEEREKLEWEKLKFQQEKEKLEEEKNKLEDDKKKVEEIKKKLSEL